MRALYTAATGMTANQIKLENIANNISNNGTNSFKKVRESFEDLVYQEYSVGGASDAVQVGSGARLSGLARDFRAGATIITGNPTDILIDGPGFFVVEGPGGDQLYTRDGHFRTDAEGNLTTQNGYRVSPGIQVPEGGELIIDGDGAVWANVIDEAGVQSTVSLGNLSIAMFTNPEGLSATGGNLFRATGQSGEPLETAPLTSGAGGLLQNAIEGSNVDVAEELISMITAQRGYELSSKVIQAADEMMQTAAQLRR